MTREPDTADAPARSGSSGPTAVFVPARRELIGTMLCFVLIWAVLDRTAALLASYRGEAGILVCTLVLVAAFACEHALSRRPLRDVAATLGLKTPDLRALSWALAMVAALLLFYPAFAAATGTLLNVDPNAPLLALGMFAQGGIAEEVLFRGFLFRRLRQGRSFWRAAWLAAIPFVAVHTLLFLTLDFPLALASLLLSLSLSFPLAWLFEVSGGSIWPPAILHAVLQGSIKLVDAGGDSLAMAIAWMMLSALVPWALFLLRPESRTA